VDRDGEVGGLAGTPDADLYAAHLREVTAQAIDALTAATSLGGIVFHAGSTVFYHRDDIEIPFRTHAHFARFVPLRGPDHLLRVRPGEPPRLFRVAPRDYWSAPLEGDPHPWPGHLEAIETHGTEEAVRALGDVSDCAFVGADRALAGRLGIAPDAVEPPELMAHLDWHRARKTGYEIACHREAARRAARGHAAARDAALSRASEREIHTSYLAASGQLEGETPYPDIVAWDEHAAVLHYPGKRTGRPDPGAVLLIDAGASAWGYASDVTRTHATAAAPELFCELLRSLDALQRELVALLSPGLDFARVHVAAVLGVARILRDAGILRVAPDEAVARGLASCFLPHGVGHQLGLHVHDVGGRQATPSGGERPPPPGYAALRNTRTCEPGHVVTVEPGIYFIPILLDPVRESSETSAAVDWAAVDALLPCGGMRIEDDVLVTPDGREDLSRPHVPAGALRG